MWTANITSITKRADNLSFEMSVDFTDGKQTFTIPFLVSDPNSVKRLVANQINQYEAIDAFIANPPLGPVDVTPEPAPPLPTDTDLAKQDYAAKRAALVQAKSDLSLGLIDQAVYDSLLQDTLTAQTTVKSLTL